MIDIKIGNKNGYIEVYNEGVLLITANTKGKINDIVECLLENNNDIWKIELLNRILYTVNTNNLSTVEVA